MKSRKNRMVIFLAFTIGSLIGVFKGEEAKQKWMFKIRSKYDMKRLVAAKRQQARQGGVLLDDIEMASYHNS